ncbi:MAG: response regulator [Alphaproteobacteria bacterium]|nr:response regulator [Alphaproteobacteria bacterium]
MFIALAALAVVHLVAGRHLAERQLVENTRRGAERMIDEVFAATSRLPPGERKEEFSRALTTLDRDYNVLSVGTLNADSKPVGYAGIESKQFAWDDHPGLADLIECATGTDRTLSTFLPRATPPRVLLVRAVPPAGPDESSPGVAFVELNLSSALAAIRDSTEQLGGTVAFLVMITGFALTIVLWQQVLRPLQRLTMALNGAMSDGGALVLPRGLPNNEIGSLARAFADSLERVAEHESEIRRLALVASRTHSGVVLADAAFNVEWVNEGFVSQTGYTLDEVKGKPLVNLLRGPNTDPVAVAQLRRHMAAGQGCDTEILQYAKDGRELWVLLEVRPAYDAKGEIANFVAIGTDITDRKRTEAALRESRAKLEENVQELKARKADLEEQQARLERLARDLEEAKNAAEAASRTKSEFLATMSHEIRTPMNGVLGVAELLLRTELDERQTDYVNTMRDSGEALLTLLNDILDLSKLEAGKLTLERIPFCISDVLATVTALMELRARDKGLALLIDRDEGIADHVIGDPSRLRQILFNLLGNAIKFTDAGSVSVHVRRSPSIGKPGALRFEVRDTGVGIPESARKHLFERFVQADSSTSRTFGGTGLGLAICRQLTELMDGTIGFESQVGRGTVFHVDLVLDPAEEGEQQADDSAGPEGDTQRSLDILVAEDHPVNQRLLLAVLGTLGHRVTLATTGIEAVRSARAGAYDLILMDVQMPEMDGVMATKIIRSLEGPVSRIPIVALTAHAMEGRREAYLAAGMTDYVSKPIKMSELARVLQSVADGEGSGEAMAATA